MDSAQKYLVWAITVITIQTIARSESVAHLITDVPDEEVNQNNQQISARESFESTFNEEPRLSPELSYNKPVPDSRTNARDAFDATHLWPSIFPSPEAGERHGHRHFGRHAHSKRHFGGHHHQGHSSEQYHDGHHDRNGHHSHHDHNGHHSHHDHNGHHANHVHHGSLCQHWNSMPHPEQKSPLAQSTTTSETPPVFDIDVRVAWESDNAKVT